ncbi:hypothetical protein H4S06_002080 [Coemansia sp. BCRC 34490]|nr:hypothetical protein H4S06_002080 [Coemansia sp. BCRC 34490]
MLETETANESAYAGTMNLAHSLLRSRVIWLTRAFVQSDVSNGIDISCQKRLGTAEMQIGPHIFASTSFFLIQSLDKTDTTNKTDANGDNDAQQQQQQLHLPLKRNDALVFEFADNKGVYFKLPLDFDIVNINPTKTSIHACFYANPAQSQKPTERVQRAPGSPPVNIDPDRGTSATAAQILTRVNVALDQISDPALADELLCFFNDPSNTVWRDYRRTLCKQQPVVKYAQSFFPPKHRQPVVHCPILTSPNEPPHPPPVSSISGSAISLQPNEEEPATLEPHQSQRASGGGKAGYTAAAAASRLEYYTFTKESSGESSSDEQEDNTIAKTKSMPPDLISGHSITPVLSLSVRSTPSLPQTMPGIKKRGRKAGTDKKDRRLSAKMASKKGGGGRGAGRVCNYCGCVETPIWRRGPAGAGTLCNACGVKWKLGKILQ